MAGVTVTPQIVNQLGLRKLAWEGYTEQPAVYSRIFKVRSSDRPYEEVFLVGDLPPAPQVSGEFAPTPIVDQDVSAPVRFIHSEYRMGVAYSQRSLRHDRYGIIQDKIKNMGKAFRIRSELSAALIFNDLTRTGGVDGLTLFNGAHTLLSSSATYSNKTGTLLGPGPIALQLAYRYGQLMPDESGYPSLRSRLMGIACHPVLVPSWRAVVGSTTAITGYPNNTQPNQGAVNPFRSYITESDIIEVPWLEDENMWFAIYEGHQLMFFWEDEPQTYTVDLGDPKGFKQVMLSRFSVGWVSPKGVYGNVV